MIPQLNSFSNFGYLVYLVVAVTLVVAASEDDKVRFHFHLFNLGNGLYAVLIWFISFCSLIAAEIGDKCTNHPMSMRN